MMWILERMMAGREDTQYNMNSLTMEVPYITSAMLTMLLLRD
jgi:hypothetical protein